LLLRNSRDHIWKKGLEGKKKENVKAADKCTYAISKAKRADTSRYILFDGENISFDASLVIYINSTNIPSIMIINKIYETQNLLSL
jgi:bacillopeptidase F (M6 metalloprotease family)